MKQFDVQNPRFATLQSLALADGLVSCLIGERQGSRLLVETTEPLAAFTAIKIEFQDSLLLGEIVAVREEAGSFMLEVRIEQVLSGLQGLMALRTRLLGEAHTALASPLSLSRPVPVFAVAGR